MQNLNDFLKSKPFFYEKKDYTRMPKAYEKIQHIIKPFKIIHIVGTNGKGSTGRFLAQILFLNGKNVGHFTSPHLFKFNERFWLNGKIIDDKVLLRAHKILQNLGINNISYFEYACLLAVILFNECDYFICEAGIGGYLDSTNIFDKEFSIFCPIGLDHCGILGQDIKSIAKSKFLAMQNIAILSDEINKDCIKIAKDIAKIKNVNLKFASEILDKYDNKNLEQYAQKFNLAPFLISNLNLACASAKMILNNLNINGLSKLDLRARCEQISDNLFVDVGHNAHAALAISKIFENKKINLIYNSFADKDFLSILKILKNITKKVIIYDYESERELAKDDIFKALNDLNIPCNKFNSFSEILNSKELYLVFGSFYLIENFVTNFEKFRNMYAG